MYKRLLLLLLVFLLNIISETTFAQQQNDVDSLLNVLKKIPDDSNKVFVYHRISYLYNYIQYKTDTARLYVDSAMNLSSRLDFKRGIIESYYQYGLVDMNEDNYAEALNYLHRYIDYHTEHGDSLGIARALYCVGTIHIKMGNDNLNLPIQFRILKIYESKNDQMGIARTLNSIAGVYWRTNKNNQAISFYKKANAIYLSLNNMARYGMGLQNLAGVYVTVEEYDSAMLLYTKALEIIREQGADAELAYILGNLGDLYEKKNDYNQALAYSLQSLEIRRKQTQKHPLAEILLDVGHFYTILKQYDKAEKHIDEGIEIANAIMAKDLLRTGYGNLSELFEAKRDFKKAYDYSKLYNQWEDSVLSEQSMQQINELEAKYETEKKDQQISLLAKDNELKVKEAQRQATIKKAFIVGFILVVIVSALAIYASRQRLVLTKKDNDIKEINLKHQLSELEMRALRAQINPHFLFNCLNSINRMIVKGENENASIYLKKFSKLVRLIVENVETNRVSLDNELALIESYIQLEELRFKGKIGFEISIDENIEKANTYLPPMVLQPFVENAIWHGLLHKDAHEQGCIKIAVKEENDALFCTIEDNGVGRKKSEELKEKGNGKSKSIGMRVTEERLKLLGKEKIKELIKIVDLKDTFDTGVGTRVEISIPLT